MSALLKSISEEIRVFHDIDFSPPTPEEHHRFYALGLHAQISNGDSMACAIECNTLEDRRWFKRLKLDRQLIREREIQREHDNCTWKFSEPTKAYPTIVCCHGIPEYTKGTTETCQDCEFHKKNREKQLKGK